jgi:hypothetical protein
MKILWKDSASAAAPAKCSSRCWPAEIASEDVTFQEDNVPGFQYLLPDTLLLNKILRSLPACAADP